MKKRINKISQFFKDFPSHIKNTPKLLKKIGYGIVMVLSAVIVLFVFNPIKFVITVIAKLLLLIIFAVNKNANNSFVKFLQKISSTFYFSSKKKYFKDVNNKLMGRKSGILYIEIATFLLLLFFFAPFALIILNATKTANQIIADPLSTAGSFEIFWKNITNIMTSSTVRYWNSFFNSIIITSGSLLTIGIFSAMAAWVLVRTKKRYSKFIFLIFLSGMVIPFQVVMLPLVRLLEVININTGIALKDTYLGVILVYIGFGAPLSVFMFHGFIKSIPMDIEEAAIIDGCSRPQLFFRIIIPILKPIFVTLLVLNGLWIWNDYLLPSLVIGITGDVRTLPLAVANLAGAYVRQWDLLLTSVLLAAIPVIILFLFAQKFIIQGMTSGAIK
jgi:raffinose/stachyose/melibiose transport system permease protein